MPVYTSPTQKLEYYQTLICLCAPPLCCPLTLYFPTKPPTTDKVTALLDFELITLFGLSGCLVI